MLDGWGQDVRYAARLLRRSPLVTLSATLSLAIGIGANTTIFTVAAALLFKPARDVVEPGRLVDVGRTKNGSSTTDRIRTISTSARGTRSSPAFTRTSSAPSR